MSRESGGRPRRPTGAAGTGRLRSAPAWPEAIKPSTSTFWLFQKIFKRAQKDSYFQ